MSIAYLLVIKRKDLNYKRAIVTHLILRRRDVSLTFSKHRFTFRSRCFVKRLKSRLHLIESIISISQKFLEFDFVVGRPARLIISFSFFVVFTKKNCLVRTRNFKRRRMGRSRAGKFVRKSSV